MPNIMLCGKIEGRCRCTVIDCAKDGYLRVLSLLQFQTAMV